MDTMEREIAKIIKDSLARSESKDLSKDLTESYVANTKVYNQTTELVSQRTKDAHVELYKKYVEILNQVSAELDTAERSEANSNYSCFRELKIEEAANMNAAYLHELYFANCFDVNSEIFMDTLTFMRLQRDWGTFENWQKDFIACALAARQGWAVTAYSTFLKRFINVVIDSNSQHVLVGMYPVLVVDMHEHAYFRDTGLDKLEYVKRMLVEVNWVVVEERVKRADKIHEALR